MEKRTGKLSLTALSAQGSARASSTSTSSTNASTTTSQYFASGSTATATSAPAAARARGGLSLRAGRGVQTTLPRSPPAPIPAVAPAVPTKAAALPSTSAPQASSGTSGPSQVRRVVNLQQRSATHHLQAQSTSASIQQPRVSPSPIQSTQRTQSNSQQQLRPSPTASTKLSTTATSFASSSSSSSSSISVQSQQRQQPQPRMPGLESMRWMNSDPYEAKSNGPAVFLVTPPSLNLLHCLQPEFIDPPRLHPSAFLTSEDVQRIYASLVSVVQQDGMEDNDAESIFHQAESFSTTEWDEGFKGPLKPLLSNIEKLTTLVQRCTSMALCRILLHHHLPEIVARHRASKQFEILLVSLLRGSGEGFDSLPLDQLAQQLVPILSSFIPSRSSSTVDAPSLPSPSSSSAPTSQRKRKKQACDVNAWYDLSEI